MLISYSIEIYPYVIMKANIVLFLIIKDQIMFCIRCL